MFWFAWTGQYNSIHWIAPTLAGVFLSTSILLIFVAYLNYLTDTYLMYAASALAANTVCRSACGAAAPLFTQYMFDALGVGGGGSLIAGVACLLAPIPFVFYKYGEPIRRRSKFAPTEEDENKKNEAEQRRDEEEGGGGANENAVSETSGDSSSTVAEREVDEKETDSSARQDDREGDTKKEE
jgi:DHA1 family multidrug resistance protein-like MFS transporter